MREEQNSVRWPIITAASSGVLIAALGAVVLVGWHIHSYRLLQIHPSFVAMVYNAALAFLLCGLSLVAASVGRERWAAVGGVFATAIGLLTLGEYVFGVDLPLDQLLMKHYVEVANIYPGRMAVNTSACFALAGAALLLLSFGRRWRHRSFAVGVIGSIVAAQSLVAFSGYFTGVPLYSWDRLTQMAIHTAVGLTLLGGGLIVLAWRDELSGGRRGVRWLPLTVGIGAATATLCLWQGLYQHNGTYANIILVFGMMMAALLGVAVGLAQVARRRASQIESINRELKQEIAERTEAEGALRLAHDEMEARIAERTADLTQAVKDLEDFKFSLDESSIVAITDQRGLITYVNDKFCEISKYTREELIGQDHRIINSGYHPKEFFRDLWTTIAGGRVWRGEVRNRAKDGSIYWMDTTIVPLLNSEGKPYQYLAIRFEVTNRKLAEEALKTAHDELERRVEERTADLRAANDSLRDEITQRERAERELAAAVKRERELFDNALDVICSIDAEGRFASINPACLNMWGYSPEELIGRQYIELVHPDDAMKTEEVAARIMAGAALTDFENRYVRKDGSVVHVMWTAMLSESQRLMFCVARDITARKLAEERQRESDERFTAFMNHSPAFAFIKDEEGRYVYVNRLTRNSSRPRRRT